MDSNLLFITGSVSIISSFNIEELGKVLTDKIFGGLEFGGRDLNIYDEVTAIFIESPIIGLKIILSGYSGYKKKTGFNLSLLPYLDFENVSNECVNLDNYLFHLLKTVLKDVEDIEVLED